MLMLPSSVRIFVAAEAVDLRRGFDGLAAATRSVIRESPESGHLFVFLNRRRDRVKLLVWDRTGYLIVYNQRSSHCTSSSSIRVCRACCRPQLRDGRSVDELVPSTALFDWGIRPGILIEPRVAVGGMRANDAVLSPSDDGVFVDAETLRHLRLREHAASPKSSVP